MAMRQYRQLEEAANLWRRQTTGSAGWKLEDAKARFSEVVRRARSEGPQRVTVRGKEAVVIISSEEYERMMPVKDQVPLVDFLESLYVEGLDLTRDTDRGRDIDL